MALIYFGETYSQLFNCTFYNFETKPIEERSAAAFGILFLVTFAGIWILYIPCIIVMCEKELLKNSCYKLMVFLGILDLQTSLYTGLWVGIICVKGIVFCEMPSASYWLGCLLGMAWKMQSTSIVLLALNRCLDTFSSKWSSIMFAGNRTYLLMTLPVLWGFHDLIWGPPTLFNSLYLFIQYNPHLGYFPDLKNQYTDITIFYNNVFVSISVPLIYGIFGAMFYFKTRETNDGSFKQQKKIFGQILIISTFYTFITVSFVVVQFLPLPAFLNPWLHWLMLIFDGVPAIIYITLNGTMRKKVKNLFDKNARKQSIISIKSLQTTITIY